MKANQDLIKLDLKHIWHPCTQMKDHEFLPLIPIKRAKGVYVYDFEGNSYIDCVGSWWVNLFGHCNSYINDAIKSQLDSLEHILLAGFTHEPIINLSKRLCALLPNPLNKCFYADNGSSAIEVALKMSFHYHLNTSQKPSRNMFLSLSNSYHGETIGALSVGDVALYKRTYEPLLLQSLTTPVPSFKQDFSAQILALEKILQEKGDQICAFVLEPLIQCAGNMNMYAPEFIKQACALCARYKIHIIFDEIATGFGRTGSMFAFEQCGVVPDFLCLSKGITGGYLPLSVVVTSDKIYNAFYDTYESNKAFLHSHSYTGNALACSAANAVLDIFESENILESNRQKSTYIANLWQNLAQNPIVKNVRFCGMVFAFDIESNKNRAGLYVHQEGLKRGLLLRPLGNTIYFMPPYVITNEQIDFVVENLKEILQTL